MNFSSLKNLASLSPKTYIFMFALVAGTVYLINRFPQLRALI